VTRLIVHADDFGLGERIDRGILKAHVEGCLTSTSIMAVGAHFDGAIALARDTPGLDLGVHLTLAEERPLSPPESIPSLVDPEGRFHRHATVFARRWAADKIDLDDVRRELSAQVERVVATGLPISHLDGHQHLHMLPGVLDVTAELATRHGIPAVRFPAEPLAPYMFASVRRLARVPQLIALRLLCARGRGAPVARTDRFAGFVFGGRLDRANLDVVLRNLPTTGTCELMCHPGLDDPDARYGHWGYRWQDELDALCDPALPDRLEHAGIRLIGYRDLQATA
jgi:hopanoid biosynthesis associated protein HpnK